MTSKTINPDENPCPQCGKIGKKGGSGVWFKEGRDERTHEDIIWAKCFGCGKSWVAWPKRERRTFIKVAVTLEGWCKGHGFDFGVRLSELAIKITKYVTTDKVEKKFDAFQWIYPCGSIHWKSVEKCIKDENGNRKYVQRWERPETGVASFWLGWNKTINEQTPNTDYSNGIAYCVEGEKEALALLYMGELAFAVPGSFGATKPRVEWLIGYLKEHHPEIHTLRLGFDADSSGVKGSQAMAKSLARNGFTIQNLKWPESAPKGFDIFDVYLKHGNALMEVLRAMEWVNPFSEMALEPVNTANRILLSNSLERTANGYLKLKDNDSQYISNCVLDIERRYYNDNKVQYWCRVSNESRTSSPFLLSSSDFADPGSFRRTIASQGTFHFYDWSLRDLAKLSEFETTKPNIVDAKLIDGYGWDEEHRFYAFPNGIITKGQFYPANDEGLIQVDGKYFSVKTDFVFMGNKKPLVLAELPLSLITI